MDQTVARRRFQPAIATFVSSLVFVMSAVPAASHGNMPTPEAFNEPTTSAQASSFGAATIRLRGFQNLYRIDREGQIGHRTRVQFGSGWVYQAQRAPTTFASGRFTQLLSGPYKSWWVATPDAALESPSALSTTSTVRLAAGSYLGIKFYAAGTVRIRWPLALSVPTDFEASRRATFAGREYYQLSSGPLAGRWLAAHRATLLGGSGGTPPSPAPVIPEPLATWNALALVYRETDVTFTRADGTDYRLQARMTNEMHSLVLDVLNRAKSSVAGWSDGLARMKLTVVDVPRPINALDKLSNSYWVGPRSVEADIDQYAPTGQYDSVFVVWQAKDAAGENVPVGGWGLTLPPGSWANGAGYSSVITPSQTWWWTTSTEPEEVFVHEWLHQVIFFHQNADRLTFDLHAGSQYGYEQEGGTWKRWLADVMRGRVPDGNRYVGITPELWRAGSPASP